MVISKIGEVAKWRSGEVVVETMIHERLIHQFTHSPSHQF
jgi:hypothetical protein